MRVRRTGDATVTQKPGPKPNPESRSKSPHQWSESEQVTELQRQIKGLRTQVKNQRAENHLLGQSLHTARKANPVTITKADRAKLLKVFAPDTGPHATEAQLTEAAQIFNKIKFNIVK
jgi:hypothetical protein